MNRIYLDNAATTSLKPQTLDKMLSCYTSCFGNAGSVHATGREAHNYLEDSRRSIASYLDCNPSEIYFTSGGTESDNWAIKGAAFGNRCKGNHLITCTTEHHAVLNTCHWLESLGFRVTYLPVDRMGRIDPHDIEKSITEQTILVSIMMANNETGTLHPVHEIADICQTKKILFHTDAVQAVGHIPVFAPNIGADMISLSAHKFHGPKGVGILYIRRGCKIDSYLHGGQQERGKRASTENVPGVVGMAEALSYSCRNMKEAAHKTAALRDRLIQGLTCIPGVSLTGHPEHRLPGICNIIVSGTDSSSLLMQLDLAGIDASAGSACTSGSLEPSHVLTAMGFTEKEARSAVRFSLSDDTTRDEVDYVLKVFPQIVGRLRSA